MSYLFIFLLDFNLDKVLVVIGIGAVIDTVDQSFV